MNLWAARPSAIAKWIDRPAGWIPGGCHEIPEEGVVLHHSHRVEYDEFAQRIDETHRIVEEGAARDWREETILTLTRAWLSQREMEHLVARCGFQVELLLGGFDGEPFGPQSNEMIWLLRAEGG